MFPSRQIFNEDKSVHYEVGLKRIKLYYEGDYDNMSRVNILEMPLIVYKNMIDNARKEYGFVPEEWIIDLNEEAEYTNTILQKDFMRFYNLINEEASTIEERNALMDYLCSKSKLAEDTISGYMSEL